MPRNAASVDLTTRLNALRRCGSRARLAQSGGDMGRNAISIELNKEVCFEMGLKSGLVARQVKMTAGASPIRASN